MGDSAGEGLPSKQPLCPVYTRRRSLPEAHSIVRKGSQSKLLNGLFPRLLIKTLSCLHFLPRGTWKVSQVSQPPELAPLPPSELFSGVAPQASPLECCEPGEHSPVTPEPWSASSSPQGQEKWCLLCSGQLSLKGLVLLGSS